VHLEAMTRQLCTVRDATGVRQVVV
jgi:hypothetical protein